MPRKLGIDGEEALVGRTLFYSVDEPDDWVGTNVAVAGGGDAADNALMLMRHAEHVTIVHRRSELKAQARTVGLLHEAGVHMLLGWKVVAIETAGHGVCFKIQNTSTDDTRVVRYDRNCSG